MSAAEGAYEILVHCVSGLFGRSRPGLPRVLQAIGLFALAMAVVAIPIIIRRGDSAVDLFWPGVATISFIIACICGVASGAIRAADEGSRVGRRLRR